jgi:hypothetical protein
MVVAVYLLLLSAATVGLCARWLAHRLPPATATRLLALAAVVTAVACSFFLGVLAFLLIAHVPAVAAPGHWSTTVLQADNHIPLVVSVAGAIASPAVTALLLTVLYRCLRAILDARAHCARIGGEPGRLVVLDSDPADAYALDAGRGRVVVTRRSCKASAHPNDAPCLRTNAPTSTATTTVTAWSWHSPRLVSRCSRWDGCQRARNTCADEKALAVVAAPGRTLNE